MSDRAWLPEVPPPLLSGDHITLVQLSVEDRGGLTAAINASLEHLQPWMPWAQQPATPASIGSFLETAVDGWQGRREFQYTIRSGPDEPILGCCGLHARIGPLALEIGYWVHVAHTGRGLATAAAHHLTRAGLGLCEAERVEIHCDAANVASAAIPSRLGYRLDRIERREPEAPGETGQQMIWVLEAEPPSSD